MRTTLVIDDDVLQTVRAIAEHKKISLGKAISDLARKGLNAQQTMEQYNGFPIFSVSADAKPITPDDVKKHEDEM